MRKSILIISCMLCLAVSALQAKGQRLPTASRAGNLQVGGGFALAVPDYTELKWKGYMFYGDFDFKYHLGVEAEFHQVNEPDDGPRNQMYERTYEVGLRYHRTYGAFKPYAKGMVGRGVFNFPISTLVPVDTQHPNLAYNLYAFGAGVDYALRTHINLRADYEYQFWPGFPTNGLQPSVMSFGAAYHF